MSEINEQCVYRCGPYKGYFGRAVYDSDADLFHGEVAGTRDVITFQGRTPGELGSAFQESVDDYLAFCAEWDELEVRGTYAAQEQALGQAGWDDPELDEYSNYDSHRS